MCGGGGASEPDYTVQNQQARLAQRYDDHYRQYFLPIERELVSQARDDQKINTLTDQAGARALSTWDAGSGKTGRQLGRYGQQMTARQQQAQTFKDAFGRSFANMESRGKTRAGATQLQGTLRDNMLALGRDTRAEGLGLFNQAGNMEAQRNSNNQQIAAQNHASRLGFIGQAAGTAAGIGLMVSDKNKKQHIKKRTDRQDMNDVRSFANYDYDYKPGQGGTRAQLGHIGGMAQEMPASISDGKTVDVGDSVMLGLGAIRNLDKRLQKLENKA